jgi:hypothetical protein
MGLKGYRLWVNLIQPAEPHRVSIPLLSTTTCLMPSAGTHSRRMTSSIALCRTATFSTSTAASAGQGAVVYFRERDRREFNSTPGGGTHSGGVGCHAVSIFCVERLLHETLRSFQAVRGCPAGLPGSGSGVQARILIASGRSDRGCRTKQTKPITLHSRN